MEIRVAEDKIEKGQARIEALRGKASQGGRARAKEVLEVAGFLNYIEKVAQGGFARLRAMWKAVAESGANEGWRHSHFVNPWVELGEEIREDLGRREEVSRTQPGA